MNADQPSFYVTGGTLRPDALSYVERAADAELYQNLKHGELCYALTSRQMGKSSLMVRTVQRLRREGTTVAMLDLTAIGQNVTVEQWYDGMMAKLGQQLDLEDELLEFWRANERWGPLQRWTTALEKIILPGLEKRTGEAGKRGQGDEGNGQWEMGGPAGDFCRRDRHCAQPGLGLGLELVVLEEHGCEAFKGQNKGQFGPTSPIEVWTLPVFPRRDKRIHLQFYQAVRDRRTVEIRRTLVAQFRVSNPDPRGAWKCLRRETAPGPASGSNVMAPLSS